MNIYEMLAESCRQFAASGDISQERAAKKIRIYDFLSTCDRADKVILFDSGIYNNVVEGIVERSCMAVGLDAQSCEAVRMAAHQALDRLSIEELL